MPGLHVVGEIVGAMGLRPRGDALGLTHWLDLLSLHPSTNSSFFCRWRLRFRDQKGRLNAAGQEWRVLEGATEGQTQAHGPSPIMPLYETITTSTKKKKRTRNGEEEDTDELLELDTLWCHPIDLHLAMSGDGLPTSWPFLEFRVCRLDEFHREHPVGSASIALPLAQHEFFVDLPIVQLTRESPLIAILPTACVVDSEDDGSEDESIVAEGVGTMFIRLAVIQQGFHACGFVAS